MRVAASRTEGEWEAFDWLPGVRERSVFETRVEFGDDPELFIDLLLQHSPYGAVDVHEDLEHDPVSYLLSGAWTLRSGCP